MQEIWTFKCSPLCNEEELQDILVKNEKELGTFISYYFKSQGAIAEEVRLKGPIRFMNKSEGEFVVKFDLIYFNACLNIHEKEKDTMKVDFIINQSDEKLILKGEYWPERSFDEL